MLGRWSGCVRILGRLPKPHPTIAFLVAAGSLVAPPTSARSEEANSPADPWYEAHVYIGDQGQLSVHDVSRLQSGDSLLVFDRGRPARYVRVRTTVPADSAAALFASRKFEGVYHDKALWDRNRGYWYLRGDPELKAMALIESWPGDEEESLPLAIKGLPATALWTGGVADTLSAEELERLSPTVADRLPPWPKEARTLRLGLRFQPVKGHEMTVIYVGRAYDNASGAGAPIDSVDIHELYLHNDRVVAVQGYLRSSTEPEGADMDPPVLSDFTWAQDLAQTIGFVSRDGGRVWERLYVATTFEGINWGIERLDGDSPLLWNFYLYTPH